MALNVIWLNVVFVSSHTNGKGRVATLVSPYIPFVVVEWGANLLQRFVLIMLNPNNRILGLSNLYASNDVEECAAF
jgi:hypothetical protein